VQGVGGFGLVSLQKGAHETSEDPYKNAHRARSAEGVRLDLGEGGHDLLHLKGARRILMARQMDSRRSVQNGSRGLGEVGLDLSKVEWTAAGFSSLLRTLSGSKQGVVDICRVFKSAAHSLWTRASPLRGLGEEMGWIWCASCGPRGGDGVDLREVFYGARWAISGGLLGVTSDPPVKQLDGPGRQVGQICHTFL